MEEKKQALILLTGMAIVLIILAWAGIYLWHFNQAMKTHNFCAEKVR